MWLGEKIPGNQYSRIGLMRDNKFDKYVFPVGMDNFKMVSTVVTYFHLLSID